MTLEVPLKLLQKDHFCQLVKTKANRCELINFCQLIFHKAWTTLVFGWPRRDYESVQCQPLVQPDIVYFCLVHDRMKVSK